jgi:hypothetical protein
MANSLVAFDTTNASVASGTNVTTASLSWQTGDVVIVFAGNEGNGTQTLNTPTTTGSGISFGTAQQLHQNASDCGGGCWAAVASASSSGTFSVNDTHSGSRTILIGVYIVRSSSGIGNSVLYTGTSPTGASLTPTAADGTICWMALDWAAAAAQTAVPTATTHGTSTPGPSASPVSTQLALLFTFTLAELDDQTSAGAVSYGVGGAGTGAWTIIAIEAKATGGTSVTVIPPARTDVLIA